MPQIDSLVAFSILMENSDGILGKSPDYVHEKYELCTMTHHPENLLDNMGKTKFDIYMENWFREAD